MVNFTPKKLSADEVELMEVEYRKIEIDPEQSEEIWQQMDSFFGVSSIDQDKVYNQDYFRWYTELSWRFLQTRNYDFVVNIAVTRQIPMAILVGFDPWKELIWYLAFRAELKSDMESLYGKMREAFIKSEAVIGMWQGSEYKVSDLVNEVQVLGRLENDSIKEAEFRTKLLQIFVPENDTVLSKYVMADPSDRVVTLISIASFFLGVEPTNIWYVVDAYTHPEFEQEKTVGVTPKPAVPPSTVRPSSFSAPVPKPVAPPQPTPVAKPPVSTKPTSQQIKSQIESQFKKDADGNFADIEGVMAKLSDLAEKNNDPKIAEMIYFDETESKFKWNI